MTAETLDASASAGGRPSEGVDRKLRIFISSPGDVGQERLIAARVIERLQGEFWGVFDLEPIVWEHEPLRASAHFQEQILPPSQTDIVICILWSRLGTRLPEQFCREDGSRYASGTEWEFEDALRAFRERGLPDLMVYRKTAEPHVSISDEAALLQRLAQKKALEAFIDRWFGSASDSFRLAFHTFSAPDAFETMLETHLRKLLQQRLPEHFAEHADVSVPIEWHQGSPFRGLEVFDVEHAPVFFGRTRAIAEIKEALVRQAERGCAFVLLLGMSGCGKSSLARAGVLPTITQPGVIERIGLWRWCLLRPSDSPEDLLLALARALLEKAALPELVDAGFDARELAALFRQAPERAAAAIRMGLGRAAEAEATTERLTSVPEARLAVVVDQLEELFTLAPVDTREREAFVAALSALARSGGVWVMATMRSDFYPRCAEIPELAALKEGTGQYDVLPPSFTEIAHMIRCPARAAGLRFEVDPHTGERLDDRLHEAAARDPEALPLLEFTLDELFERRAETGVLTFAAYEHLGGLEGALARRAEEIFAAQEPAVQAVLPSLLRALVAAGSGDKEIVAARRAPLATVASTPERQALVDAFVRARLLVTDRTEDGQALVRVAHEALLRRWPRLQAWLRDDRGFLQTRERVAGAALRWREEKRRADFLLPEGKPLADALDLLAKRREDLDRDAVEFIEASRRAVARARLRRLRVVAGVTAAFFSVTIGFGAFSYGEWRKAEQQKRLALDAVNRLTYDIPRRLIDLPGSRPALRTIFQENLQLLDRLADARALPEKRANFRYMGDIWLLLGETEQADRAYQKSLSIARQLAKGRSGIADRWELAVSEARVGDARLERGDAQGALQLYTPSLALLEPLAKRDRNPRLRRDLSAGYEKLGDTRLALNDLPGALQAYQRDLAMAEELAKQDPGGQAQRDLSASCTKIGDVRLAAGDAPAALASYQKSVALLSALTRGHSDAAAERDLSASYAKVGDAFMALHQPRQARAPYLAALTLSRRLARDPSNARAQRDLSVSYTRIGELRLALGDLRGALAAYQSSRLIAEGLATDKSNMAAQQDLKYVYERMRDIEASLGDERAALMAQENSLRVALDLVQDPKSASGRREQALLYQEMASSRLQRRDLNAALEAYRQALEIDRELIGDGHDVQARRDLAAAYDKVAYVELLCRRPQEALAVAVEGTAIDPQHARLKLTLAHAYLFANQFEKAKALYLRNRTGRVDDRQSFANAVLSDFREFRAQGLRHPDMEQIEKLLSRMPGD